MRSLWCVLLVILFAAQSGGAADKDTNDPNDKIPSKWDIKIKDPNDPNSLIRTKWKAILSVLHENTLSQELKKREIRKIVAPIFDFPLMAKLVLGRKHWPKLNPEQCERFTRLFSKKLRDSYVDKISLYTDEEGLVKPALRKAKSVHIPMDLISNDKTTAILYKIRKVERGWKIFDVEVQGVSVILTYKSQFDDILRKDTVEELLARLEKKSAAR